MADIIMHICPSCAWFKGRRKCDFCNQQMLPTETTLTEAMKLTDKQEEELVNHYIETLIKDTYDPKAREHREANEKLVFAGYVPPTNNSVKCHYCGSTNTKKISSISKAGSVAMFGIFSKKIHKEWHCNSCGSDF